MGGGCLIERSSKVSLYLGSLFYIQGISMRRVLYMSTRLFYANFISGGSRWIKEVICGYRFWINMYLGLAKIGNYIEGDGLGSG